MTNLIKYFAAVLGIVAFILPATISANAETTERGFVAKSTKGNYDEVAASLEDAIINRGYNIDFVGHLNQMLKRTSKAVGSVTPSGQTSPYKHAKFMHFCSAKHTHEVISANPQNIAVCPYVVFVYETNASPGEIHVGYRRPITGPSKLSRKGLKKIEDMLNAIITEAVE